MPEDELASYARNVLIGGHFTADELHAIKDDLVARALARAKANAQGRTLGR